MSLLVPAQLSLLPDVSLGPEGLRYQPDFISEEDERDLVARIQSLPLEPFQFGAFEGKRRVASFGWRYDYSRQSLEKTQELPDWIAPVIAKVETFADLRAGSIRQVLFTEYDAGVGIGWHRDKRHFDQVFGLSLVSACKFRLRRRTAGGWQRHTLEAEPRSLYRMAGLSRHSWEHSIPPVQKKRYSVTFRTMAASRVTR
jgi:alkylated DNA repair dioxygenase AlkB